jgi:hypothetical protein
VFRSVCHLPGLTALGCETAFGGVFARGISAATTQVCARFEKKYLLANISLGFAHKNLMSKFFSVFHKA